MSSKIVMYAVGDLVGYRPDLDSQFRHVSEELNKADLTFGQLEAILSDNCGQINVSTVTRMPCSSVPAYAETLKRAGLDVISFATNHCMDYGRVAFLDTLENIRNAGLTLVGAGANEEEARRFPIIDCKGTKIAILGYCSILPQDYWAFDYRPGCNPARALNAYTPIVHDQPGTPIRMETFPHHGDMYNMLEDIAEAKKLADIVVLSMHWGIHFTQAEIADYQRDYAHIAIDNGVDIVIGHHAHIIKPIEVYKGRVIFYSLGNFALEEFDTMTRDLAMLNVDRKKSKLHKEVNSLTDFGKTQRTFPVDSYMEITAKIEIEDKKISRVCYKPTYLPEDCSPVILKADDPMFDKINEYMNNICAQERIHTKFTVEGDEVIIG